MRWNRRTWLLAMAVLSLSIRPIRAEQPQRLRVLSYNIHHGEGTDGRLDLERIARVIQAQKPDLVALQEVDVKTQRTGRVDQAAALAKLTGMHVFFGPAMDYDGGQYGDAVLSRYPLLETKNHPLPKDTGTEPRTAVAAVVRLGRDGPKVLFASTHLEHTADGPRVVQAREINRQLVRAGGDPAILAGDMNAAPGSRPMKTLLAHWTDATAGAPKPTCPSKDPKWKIDYVLFRPAAGWRVIETRVVDEPVASDHCPLLVVLEWVEPAERAAGE